MPKRTCPAPTPSDQLRPGDRIRFQTEAMPEEREATIERITDAMVYLNTGEDIAIGANYIRKIDGDQAGRDAGGRGNALTPEQAELRKRFCLAVNRRIDHSHDLTIPQCVAAVKLMPEFAGLATCTTSGYRQWRHQYGIPLPKRTAKNSPTKAPAQPPSTPQPQAPEHESHESHESHVQPPADPAAERRKAIRYAAAFVLANARRGESIDDALANMMTDREWERCGGPPTELEILRRAHELDPNNGPICGAINCRVLVTCDPSDPSDQSDQSDLPVAIIPAEMRADVQACATWCGNLLTTLDILERDRARLAKMRAILDGTETPNTKEA